MFNIANVMKTQSVKYNLTQITPPPMLKIRVL